jgi:hypothetical protein
MATAKQIAARKRFAEMARSGELAKMRKKATKRNPTPTKARAVKSNPKNRDALTEKYRKMDFETFKDYFLENEDNNMHSENVVILAMRYGTAKMVREAENIANTHDRVGYLDDDLATARIKLSIPLLSKFDIENSDLIRKTVKRNPAATRAPARPRTKLVSNGREKNPIHGYTVMCGRSGRVLGYADTLPMAKAMATAIANDRNMQVKIEKN